MVDVTIKFEGKKLIPAIRIRDKNKHFTEVILAKNSALIKISRDEEYKIFWLVVGEPATEYTITMSVPNGYGLKASRNPLTRVVPANQLGYGRQRFLVYKETISN